MEKHLSKYVPNYLESLRDEAIAYAIEGRGRSLAQVVPERERDPYFYPKQEQLEPYRRLLGEEKFKAWSVEKIWQEKVVEPFRQSAKDIARVSARLASTPKPQRAKLAALFEIEPAINWRRLEKWLDDGEVRKRVGRSMPKLAALPKKYADLPKRAAA